MRRLLGAVSQVIDVVAGTEGANLPMWWTVHLAGVAGHGFGQAESVGAAGAEEVVPEPVVGQQFGVVPGPAADVVFVLMARLVVLAHHVAVVPEPIPAALVHLVVIEVEGVIQLVFRARAGGCGNGPAGSRNEGAVGVVVLRRGHQQGRLGGGLFPCRLAGVGGDAGERPERQFMGVGGAQRRRPNLASNLHRPSPVRGRWCRSAVCPWRGLGATRTTP